ncbi:MAG: MBL fold metallo-hydrolase [Acidobacteriota bacterium]
MIIDAVCVGMFQVNCYLLADESAGIGVLVDPGDEGESILEMIRGHGVNVSDILITHSHLDHVGALDEVRDALGARVHMNPKELPMFERVPAQGLAFGLRMRQPRAPEEELIDDQVLQLGGLAIRVIETPGHSPGGVCLLLEQPGRLLLTGDTLFAGGIGRTDLWGGSYDQLIDSIKKRLLSLDDDLAVYPGHGPPTTIGEERRNNPFLQDGLQW